MRYSGKQTLLQRILKSTINTVYGSQYKNISSLNKNINASDKNCIFDNFRILEGVFDSDYNGLAVFHEDITNLSDHKLSAYINIAKSMPINIETPSIPVVYQVGGRDYISFPKDVESLIFAFNFAKPESLKHFFSSSEKGQQNLDEYINAFFSNNMKNVEVDDQQMRNCKDTISSIISSKESYLSDSDEQYDNNEGEDLSDNNAVVVSEYNHNYEQNEIVKKIQDESAIDLSANDSNSHEIFKNAAEENVLTE